MHVFSIGRSQHLYFQGVMRLFDWPNFLVAAMLLQEICGYNGTMKLNYYPETDSLYIDLSEKTSAESGEVFQGVVLDYDAEAIHIQVQPYDTRV